MQTYSVNKCFFQVSSVFSIFWDTSFGRLWLHKLHQIFSSRWPFFLLLCNQTMELQRKKRLQYYLPQRLRLDSTCTFLNMNFKGSEKGAAYSSRKRKEKITNTFLETEETGTQQETILKCKNMHNCYGDEVSHSS